MLTSFLDLFNPASTPPPPPDHGFTHFMYVVMPFISTVFSATLYISCCKRVYQIHKDKGVADLSPFPYLSMILNTTQWTFYGILKDKWSIYGVNGFGFFCGVLYHTIYFIYSPRKKYVGILTAATILYLGFIFLYILVIVKNHNPQLQLGIIAAIVTVVMFAAPLATLYTVIKKKSTDSIDFLLSLCVLLNCISWTVQGIFFMYDPYPDDPSVYIPNSLGLLLSIFQLSLFVIYRKSKSTITGEVINDEEGHEHHHHDHHDEEGHEHHHEFDQKQEQEPLIQPVKQYETIS